MLCLHLIWGTNINDSRHFLLKYYYSCLGFLLQKLRQQMEEVYGEQSVQSSMDLMHSRSSHLLAQSSPQHHHAAMVPLLEGGGNNIPHSQSRYCKEFMDQKFDEVCSFL